MSSQPTTTEQDDALALIDSPSPEALQAALAEGQLQKLSIPQRLQFLASVCKSTGLNPLTRPFEFITLQGRVVLYARKDATDQLRKRDNVSLRIISREHCDGVYVVTAQATTPNGRLDESVGAVPCQGLKGEGLANAMMKAEAKAKRRVTLSICGLGFMDETEIAGAQAAPFEPSQVQMPQSADVQPKQDTPPPPPPQHEEASNVVDVPVEAVEDTVDPVLLGLLTIIGEADPDKLTQCVAEVRFVGSESGQETAKRAIKSRAAVLGVKWDKNKEAFV